MNDAARPRHTILIVDDERENLNLLENVLGGDHAIQRAQDGASALALLEHHAVDMVISDQRMPGLRGVQLLEQVGRLHPDTIRILITAYPDIAVTVDAINRGRVKRYVSKPFDPEELRTIVRQEFEAYDLARTNRELTANLEQAVDELTGANQKLQQLDTLKDSLLASVSHELRTPLVSSIGYVDLILSGGLGPVTPPTQKGLRIAQRNLNRLLALIQDLLSLARLKLKPQATLNRRPFQLRELVDECVESLKGRSKKTSLAVRVRIPRDLPPVAGDEERIHSVLTNVLSNAEKFTPDEARISIRVTARPKGRCTVEVRDNGIGPGAGGARSNFPAFSPGDEEISIRYGGLGIGLALAQQILQLHGGSLTLAPGPKEGAVVTFDLPLAGRRKRQ